MTPIRHGEYQVNMKCAKVDMQDKLKAKKQQLKSPHRLKDYHSKGDTTQAPTRPTI